MTGPHSPRQIVVMGVSGAGKSTVGLALAARTGAVFVDADDCHPRANVEKMRSGIPLDDRDRRRDELADRLASRAGHFMPVTLLVSQLDTLEPLGADEAGITVTQSPGAQVRGFQGNDLGPGSVRILAGPKHFAGYGAALGGRDYDECTFRGQG